MSIKHLPAGKWTTKMSLLSQLQSRKLLDYSTAPGLSNKMAESRNETTGRMFHIIYKDVSNPHLHTQ